MSDASPNIPTVDLTDLASTDPARLQRGAAALREAFGRYGLVYVKNHGVDAAALERLYDAFGQFIAQPDAAKRPYGRSDIWYQRGWTPPNTEVAVAGNGQPDFKECYFAAPHPVDPEAALEFPQLYPENVWPERAPAFFGEGLVGLGLSLHAAGLALLRGAALALALPEGTFAELCEKGPHVTRTLHYLPLKAEQVNTGIVWGEEHTDFNLLTLLPGGRFLNPEGRAAGRPDDQSGLYLRTRATPEHPAGQLVRGTPPAGCIVAQVGQQLEILTGGTFLATPHVITAPGVPGWSRQSAAHFMHVHTRTVLFPLAHLRTPEAAQAYAPPVLAGTYDIKTLVDIGLAPASALDQLGYRHYDRLDTQRAQR
ncbi:isopenicillin N synthase family oxygenase [Aggregicoccus sp. 17bor-14]|uniref:isopenicillin N synthase family dioxygenase n=1 Tax=Myxococcaceae TaxID=31 RepID=UPI00129C18BE|nr:MULTISPECIES: 2-oxoglutarate and iron-dependent oxygenase domain-containing protein [Myxococcaceae]MBF5043211.1 isopenicillin N synthase family oxygenase [Simulacricoccus sp. 17bor-14]MRI88968.1 isopenicillin N synthase family oxygenase [Aggregicoccus sp. 17bor-14]